MPKFYLTDQKPDVQAIYKAYNPTLGLPQSNMQMEVGQHKPSTVAGILTAYTDEQSNNPALHNSAYTMFTTVASYVSSANLAAVNTALGTSLTANATAVPAVKHGDEICFYDSTSTPPAFFKYIFKGEI